MADNDAAALAECLRSSAGAVGAHVVDGHGCVASHSTSVRRGSAPRSAAAASDVAVEAASPCAMARNPRELIRAAALQPGGKLGIATVWHGVVDSKRSSARLQRNVRFEKTL